MKMVKMKITLLTFLSLLVFETYAQEGYKVIYKVEPRNIIKQDETYTKRMKYVLEKTIEYSKKERYILLLNNKNSYFSRKARMDTDSDDKLTIMYSGLAKLHTAFNVNVFVDFQKNTLDFTTNLAGKDYYVHKDEFYNFSWDIKNKTKVISGLEARKAVGKYYDIIRDKEIEIIAWFIPSIPIPAGPDIYFGLPGLVGEIQLRKAIVKISSIDKIDGSIEKPDFEDTMTYKEYQDFVEKGNEMIKRNY